MSKDEPYPLPMRYFISERGERLAFLYHLLGDSNKSLYNYYSTKESGYLWKNETCSMSIPQVKGSLTAHEDTYAKTEIETQLTHKTCPKTNDLNITLPLDTYEDPPRSQMSSFTTELKRNARVTAHEKLLLFTKFFPLYKMLLEDAQKTAQAELHECKETLND
eukprot:Tbor_TRINITY_DN6198_c1_g1::TRINITY_DN6198_c1_g1_i12::g.21951::m.21951